MEYVLMCTKSKQIHYVSLTTTRAIKKVTDLSQASRFMDKTDVKDHDLSIKEKEEQKV